MLTLLTYKRSMQLVLKTQCKLLLNSKGGWVRHSDKEGR